ncbi:hypothetical protein NDA03_25840 [Trichocoleus sp. Lan]|uniref:hypothetical protein n=1 Tax=Trichocoleus sp. Lan TaxID=2933927 RepID=UPI00329A6BA0
MEIFVDNHPTTETVGESSYSRRSQPCQHCGYETSSVIKMPPSSPHYAALRCGGCDVFQGWQPKPKNQEKAVKQTSVIDRLLADPNLISQWESEFLKSIRKRKALSPRQTEILEKIQSRLRAWA